MCHYRGENHPSPLPLHSKDGALQIRHHPVCPWLPSASTFMSWRDDEEQSCWFFESIWEWLWKTKGRPKDKEAKTVMNSILKAGTLQCLMTSMSILEVLGFCQVLFRPFLKVTIQTTIKNDPNDHPAYLVQSLTFCPKQWQSLSRLLSQIRDKSDDNFVMNVSWPAFVPSKWKGFSTLYRFNRDNLRRHSWRHAT